MRLVRRATSLIVNVFDLNILNTSHLALYEEIGDRKLTTIRKRIELRLIGVSMYYPLSYEDYYTEQ